MFSRLVPVLACARASLLFVAESQSVQCGQTTLGFCVHLLMDTG